MNRRSFLGALLGLACVPVIVPLLPAIRRIEVDIDDRVILAPFAANAGALMQLRIWGGGEPCRAELARADGGLVLATWIGEGQGSVFSFMPGEEILFTERDPLALVLPRGALAHAVFHDGIQMQSRRFNGAGIVELLS